MSIMHIKGIGFNRSQVTLALQREAEEKAEEFLEDGSKPLPRLKVLRGLGGIVVDHESLPTFLLLRAIGVPYIPVEEVRVGVRRNKPKWNIMEVPNPNGPLAAPTEWDDGDDVAMAAGYPEDDDGGVL